MKKQTASGTTLYVGADTEIDPAGGHSNTFSPDVKWVNGAINWLHRDHLTSVRRVTDASGALTRASVYQPYGVQTETVLAPLSPAEPKGWIGERTDPETGLTYLHARYYDASLGRFLSPDWWDASDPGVGTDRYGYSMGDPVNRSDPNGHVIVVDEWSFTFSKGWASLLSASSESSKALPTARRPGLASGIGLGIGAGAVVGKLWQQHAEIYSASDLALFRDTYRATLVRALESPIVSAAEERGEKFIIIPKRYSRTLPRLMRGGRVRPGLTS